MFIQLLLILLRNLQNSYLFMNLMLKGVILLGHLVTSKTFKIDVFKTSLRTISYHLYTLIIYTLQDFNSFSYTDDIYMQFKSM
jgi:hypothetical protein